MTLMTELTLPCGQVLPNRLAKAAMSENMALPDHSPGVEFGALYRRWATGGVGLCITGNVMVDSLHLGEPHNVVIEKGKTHIGLFRDWAKANNSSSMKIWVQLNHPGKQSPAFLNPSPVAPSPLPLQPPLNRAFQVPRELTEVEIQDIISRFGFAAGIVKEAGFDGVQIHGAHGYLISQFLSPRHNIRTDKWGGTLENRLRFASEIYLAIRKAIGKDFPIGFKLNTSDFQKGGLSHQDSILVAQRLSEMGMDLLEISGGSYETPVMMDTPQKQSTQKREAYFLTFASEIKKQVTCPVMVTGGFRTAQFMSTVLAKQELDVIGLARPLAIEPDLPRKFFEDSKTQSLVRPVSTGLRALDRLLPLEIIWYTPQLHRMGRGQEPDLRSPLTPIILKSLLEIGKATLRKKCH